MKTKHTLVGLGLLAACAHAGSPAPASAPRGNVQREQANAPAASDRAAAKAEPSPADSEKSAAELEPQPPASLEDYMEGHFVIATWSRDMVINGILEALREPLLSLADFDYRPVVPGGWMAQIAALQATARLTANAKSLDAAAVGVATLARQCGDCHAEQRHKPYFGPDIRGSQRPPENSLRERMDRHIWAADRMWEGLTAPSEDAWNAGATALAAVPLESPSSDVVLSEPFKARLRAIRDVGTNALAAESRAERADVYATLLASCANCHLLAEELSF